MDKILPMKRIHVFYNMFIPALMILACCACAGRLSDTRKLRNHISIDGVDVSARTVGEARTLLEGEAQRRLSETSLTLLLPDQSVTLTAEELGLFVDIEASLKAAAKLGREGGERIIASGLSADKNALWQAVCRFARNYSAEPLDASVSIDQSAAVPMLYSAERQGLSIDARALYKAVLGAVDGGSLPAVSVPYTAIAPAVTLEDIQARQQLVTQFSTNFEGAPYNDAKRVQNITKAAGLINGMVLMPGEEFDCNAVLGDRTAENGWFQAPGIRNGRYESEYGGGVCQVSSTLFNAVMMADLSITERAPHSWPMGYVDIGRDATISTGGKNFRFVNSTDAPLYIFMYVDMELQTLTASLYGKPLENGMYIVISSEKTGTLESAGEEIMLDETLPYNTK